MIIAAVVVSIAFILACIGLKYVPLDGTARDQQRMDYFETVKVVESHREDLAA